VLQCVGFVRWVAALLILPKRWLFVSHFLFVHFLSCRSFRVSANVLPLGAVADFQHQTFTNIDKFLIQDLSFQKITETAMAPNGC
jgi:hypothetical protein